MTTKRLSKWLDPHYYVLLILTGAALFRVRCYDAAIDAVVILHMLIERLYLWLYRRRGVRYEDLGQ